MQFGIALPIVIGALILLLIFAARRRAFAALLLIGVADFAVMYFAKILQPWPGYPRLNLIPLAMAALAWGFFAEFVTASRREAILSRARDVRTQYRRIGPAMRDAFRPSSARSFIEHSDAPLFFPIREALAEAEAKGLIAPGSRVDLFANGKRIFEFFWAGPLEDQYPDLAARYRLRSASFTGTPSRCRCTDPSIAHLAIFIRFTNLGTSIPPGSNRSGSESVRGRNPAHLQPNDANHQRGCNGGSLWNEVRTINRSIAEDGRG